MKKQAFNPYLPSYEYIPDAEPRIFEGRLYVFGSHDKYGGKWYCENDYVTWSAPLDDLGDWRYEGVIYSKDQDPRPGDMYAPDVIKGSDGKYYLYYSKAETSVIGVARATRPAGPYEFIGEVKYKNGVVMGEAESEYYQFDPSVLVDDDGRVWLYSGSGQYDLQKKIKQKMVGCTVTELESDMVTVKNNPKIILPGSKRILTNKFFEGPSIRKINNLYYLVYPVRCGSGLHYATSIYPDKDFKQRGRIHSTSNIGISGHSFVNSGYPLGNNHGGMVCIKGQWYIFDHRITKSPFARQGVAEPFTFNKDGTINQVEATSCGLNGKPLSDNAKYPAYIACNLMGKKHFGFFRHPFKHPDFIQDGEDGDETARQYITNMKNGYTAGFKYFDFTKTSGVIKLTFRSSKSGKIIISTKDKIGDAIAKIEINATDEWQTVAGNYKVAKGKQALFFTYHGKGVMELLDFTLS